VHGGFVSVNGAEVTILSDLAELKSTIDVGRARQAHERAEAALRAGDDATVAADLRRASARLKAAGAQAG